MNHDEINLEIRNQAATHANVLVYSYTYNHDLPHPAFLKREGFVRALIRYQGMVGKPIDDGTRLTWLVNMDMGSMVPSVFTRALVNSRESTSDWRTVFGARTHNFCRSLGGLLHLSLSLPHPLLYSLALPPSLPSVSLPPSLPPWRSRPGSVMFYPRVKEAAFEEQAKRGEASPSPEIAMEASPFPRRVSTAQVMIPINDDNFRVNTIQWGANGPLDIVEDDSEENLEELLSRYKAELDKKDNEIASLKRKLAKATEKDAGRERDEEEGGGEEKEEEEKESQEGDEEQHGERMEE